MVPRFCTCIIFNHRHEANLPVLRRLYAQRFPALHFIMPFYRGGDPDVLPVSASSYVFQSYLTQAYRQLQPGPYTHYLFFGDDLVLNPRLNEQTLADTLLLTERSAYIKHTKPLSLHTLRRWWYTPHIRRELRGTIYAHSARELPTPDEAAALLARHNVVVPNLSPASLQGLGLFWRRLRAYPDLLPFVWDCLLRRPLPYPVVEGYSDFVVVPAPAMKLFTHYCGVLAAMGVFVEVALPTALLWSCEHVVRETDITSKGLEIWTKPEVDALKDQHHADLRQLLDAFPENQLYVHPVKFSQWKTDGVK